MRANLSERFWAKVERSGECWVWTAMRFRNKQGQPTYGGAVVDGRLRTAHRVVWEMLYGPIPAGLMVLHTCDNPPCVRPSHLMLGTHYRNMEQMVARRRFVHGLRHHSNRLTEAQVREIKHRLALGQSIRDMAAEFGVTYSAIYLIANGKNWKYLDEAG